ncbi:hypothetical protein AALP_AA8G501100 [Arabis alpina]|uniref:Uncharacterized protein n=1 Tax=Arabis alpina TaxID=50452 RepID=A0A087GEM1_ARAAL|nr:hypothetical protein AALP_AA8G501100 [Arabis alpina]
MMMLRALSTRKKDQGSYKKLGDKEATGVGLLEGKPQSVPASSSHGKSPEVEKTSSSVHPLLSFFDVRLKRKKKKTKKKSVTTAKPEFARYLEYVKEGGISPFARTIMPTFYTEPFHSQPPISNGESKQLEDGSFTRHQMSPSLYATPKDIPLPYSPTSYPPSPYIVNHKGRGPRSSSEVYVPPLHGNADMEAIAEDHTEGVRERAVWDCSPPHGNFWNEKQGRDNSNGRNGSSNGANGLEWEIYLLKSVRTKGNKEHEFEDYYNKPVSFTSNKEVEDGVGAGSSHGFSSSTGEFFDARDELSSYSGTPSSVNNIENELRTMRSSLLLETERRKQAEETLEQMQVHWRRIREQLAHAGLFVPLDPTNSQYSLNIADELRCQLEVARFVSDSLANDLAKAEIEMEMESELEAKNFEITRLSDRLHYYETVNQEMSQRNQEAIDVARRDGQKRKRRHRWIWGSIVATISLGGAVLAWSYLPTGVSSTDVAQPQPSAPLQ